MSSSSLRVKSVQNLQDLRNFCLGNTKSLRHEKGFVKYNYHQHQLCQAIRLSAAAVVDKNTKDYGAKSCSSNSTASISKNNTSIFPKKKRMVDEEQDDLSGKLDQWVKQSVVEILNNLDEAPFLVCIYAEGEEASTLTRKTRLVSEKADAESWPLIKGRWGGDSPTPSGIILVEEMSGEDAVVSPDGKSTGSFEMMMMDKDNDSSSCSASTKVWGILIQGKGLTCPACYILKTCRVRSVSGFCTHFCLVRVKCFLETVDIQLKKLWLV